MRTAVAHAEVVRDRAKILARPLPVAPTPLRTPGDDKDALRPFLKWVGGKRALLPVLNANSPKTFGRYHEPFVGGGAVFFNLAQRKALPKGAVLSDNNERLIRAYRGVRDSVEHVISLLQEYPYEKNFYLAMRERPIDAATDAEVAAWFIYVNRTGFNGLYRVNQKNQFNVPFGDYTNPKICDAENLRACAKALSQAELRCEPFDLVAERAAPGDFVYFDPPYVPLSTTSSFTSYTANGFGHAHQQKLANVARSLKARGVHVLLSNSSAPLVRELYSEGFATIEVHAARSVNSRGDGRGKIVELLMR
ncbi:MAG: DNA adenine methylase [Polyangiaceae bacterium]|nr:DNA adenine methylase [Polyangiaceae bacterium]